MTDIKTEIEKIVSTESSEDSTIKANTYILNPYMIAPFDGDGEVQELVTSYQLDAFFKAKGEALYKAKQLVESLSKISAIGSSSIHYESTARLWRITILLEKE